MGDFPSKAKGACCCLSRNWKVTTNAEKDYAYFSYH
jgi:hypothetical protein